MAAPRSYEEATVRLPPSEEYDSAGPAEARRGTVIVPRADRHGNQDGRIPPGRAAELGLIPRLHRVSNDTAHVSRMNAARSGKSGDELYRDFYESASRQTGGEAMTPERKLAIISAAGYTVTDDGRIIPPGYVADGNGSRMAPVGASVGTAGRGRKQDSGPEPSGEGITASRAGGCTVPGAALPDVTPAAEKAAEGQRRRQPKRGAKAAEQHISAAKRAETGNNCNTSCVSLHKAVDSDPDTLDGFYDSLEGLGLGTDEVRNRPRGARRREPGMQAGVRPAETQEADVAERLARLQAPPVSTVTVEALEAAERMAAERDRALVECERLRREAASLRAAAADLQNRLADSERQHDSVRVQLGGGMSQVSVSGVSPGGEKWKLAVEGRLDFSRSGGEAVLSVLDPAYASELLAVMGPGCELDLEFGGAGTHCGYDGICDKIYGDPESRDYITLFRLSVT